VNSLALAGLFVALLGILYLLAEPDHDRRRRTRPYDISRHDITLPIVAGGFIGAVVFTAFVVLMAVVFAH
jgi:hypothetical protein